jgi:trimeric autotransporter adhesin
MRLRWRLVGLVFPAVFAVGSGLAIAEPLIGTVVLKTYKGAQGTRVQASAEELHFGHEVYSQETISTPADGATVMRFHDETQLQIGANSTVVLDNFVYDTSADTANASIKFTKGIFRYIAGQAKSEENVKLSTPTTTLTIRGTKFIVQVADDGSTIVSVIDGVVDIQPCGPAKPTRATSGKSYRVSPTCEVSQTAVIPVDTATLTDYDPGEDTGGLSGPGSSDGGPPGPPHGGNGGGFGGGGGRSGGG